MKHARRLTAVADHEGGENSGVLFELSLFPLATAVA